MRTFNRTPEHKRRNEFRGGINVIRPPRKHRESDSVVRLQRSLGNQAMQRLRRFPSVDGEGTDAPPIVREALSGQGRPLDPEIRSAMEPRFGFDLSGVKIHRGALAEDSARAVDARAYTVGRNIVFGAGQYAPETASGQRLIAHELAHVAQQRGAAAIPDSLPVGGPDDAAERTAQDAVSAAKGGRLDVSAGGEGSAPTLRREPTKPRAATARQSLDDLAAQTKGAASGKTTAGSLARLEWESLFRRHFSEPDKVEGEVESSHPRYLYSNLYGWIDAQHFFAHIQFAEEKGLQGATDKGIDIEGKQALVRKIIGPDPNDNTIYSDLLKDDLIDAADFMHYRETEFIAISMGLDTALSKQEKDLIKGFDDEKIAKLILDNAMSAWSYEDLVSNQLGVQFYRLHGAYVNAGKDADEVRQRFIDRMTEFFAAIEVVDKPATLKKKSAKLPGRERWSAPKKTLAEAKKQYPELFEFGAGTHRLRIVIHDKKADADKGLAHIAKVAPSVPGLHVEALGSQYAVYSGALSRFEAVVMKSLVSKTVPIKASAVVIEEIDAKTKKKP